MLVAALRMIIGVHKHKHQQTPKHSAHMQCLLAMMCRASPQLRILYSQQPYEALHSHRMCDAAAC
jgi:hypothetical protein